MNPNLWRMRLQRARKGEICLVKQYIAVNLILRRKFGYSEQTFCNLAKCSPIFLIFPRKNVLFHVNSILLIKYGKQLEQIIPYTSISLKGRAFFPQTNCRRVHC